MNSGIVFAFIAIILLSASDLGKKRLMAECDPMVVPWVHMPVSILVNIFYLKFNDGFTALSIQALWPALILGAILLASELCFLTALARAQASLVLPLNALVPVFGMNSVLEEVIAGRNTF